MTNNSQVTTVNNEVLDKRLAKIRNMRMLLARFYFHDQHFTELEEVSHIPALPKLKYRLEKAQDNLALFHLEYYCLIALGQRIDKSIQEKLQEIPALVENIDYVKAHGGIEDYKRELDYARDIANILYMYSNTHLLNTEYLFYRLVLASQDLAIAISELDGSPESEEKYEDNYYKVWEPYEELAELNSITFTEKALEGKEAIIVDQNLQKVEPLLLEAHFNLVNLWKIHPGNPEREQSDKWKEYIHLEYDSPRTATYPIPLDAMPPEASLEAA